VRNSTKASHFRFLALAVTAIVSSYVSAGSGDQAALQTQVDSYTSAGMQSEVDGLLSEYGALKYGDTYSADSPKLDREDSEGNADSKWTKMSYNDLSASQLIGYTSDLCANHAAYDQLVAKGIKIDQAKFNGMRDKFCKLVKAAAELKHRYDRYQSIKKNGIVLLKRAKSQEHDFNGHHRTFGGGMSLIYKPDIADTVKNGINPEETLVYDSWIKWSDNGPTPLNIIKKIREMRNSDANKCGGFGFHIINSGGVDAYLYLDVVSVTSTKITIQNCISAKYNGIKKGHAFPSVSMDAPFGYLYELEQMKDSAKAKLVDKVKTKVTSMVGANQQMIDLLKKIKG